MDVYAFQAKWRAAQGTERALAQAHVLDLCALAGLLDHALGDGVAFERAVAKAGGGTGFADAWVRGRFAMEYKGRGADLDKAYAQLLQYKDALENPPLLIVSDLDRIVVHPNFTGVVGPPHDPHPRSSPRARGAARRSPSSTPPSLRRGTPTGRPCRTRNRSSERGRTARPVRNGGRRRHRWCSLSSRRQRRRRWPRSQS